MNMLAPPLWGRYPGLGLGKEELWHVGTKKTESGVRVR